ncbi:MAG: hypothetical protein R3257_04130, partial [bacterium]|nr:hypothetical protein [bacterium]
PVGAPKPPKEKSTPKPPTPPLRFPDNPPASQVYRELKRLGVSEGQMDRGCATLFFDSKDHLKSKIYGKGDGKASACEVLDFALESYQDHPAVAEFLTEKPIPWTLQSADPNSPLDPQIQKLFKILIARIDKILQGQGLSPTDPKYQQAMALGLLAYVSLPDPEGMKKSKTFIPKLLKTLAELGLAEFAQDLREIGGLGMDRNFETVREFTAMEAIQERQGKCTELSKILFAALKMAQLEPYFVLTDPWKSDIPKLEENMKEYPNYLHVLIGVSIDGQQHLLDPALLSYQPNHRSFAPLTLRQYLALDYINRSKALNDREKPPLDLLNLAVYLDPSLGLPLINRSMAYLGLDDFESAQKDIEEAKKRSPHLWMVSYAQAVIHYEQNQIPQALAYVDQGLRYNPKVFNLYHLRAKLNLSIGKAHASRNDLLTCLKMAPENCGEIVLDQQEYFREFLLNHTVSPGLIQRVESELEMPWPTLEAKFALIGLYWEAGLPKIATYKFSEIENLTRDKNLSDPTKIILESLLDSLPPELKKESELNPPAPKP